MKLLVNKAKKAHHHLVSLPAILILALIVGSGWLTLANLRSNNLEMLELRKTVELADESGDPKHLEESLQTLQQYVTSHMNTSTRIDLDETYKRDAIARQKETAQQLGNVELYGRAERECIATGATGSLLAECINDRLTGQAGDLVDLPDARLYRYSFASPYLSLDVAGVTLVLFCIFVYAGLYRLSAFIVRLYRRDEIEIR